MNPVARAFPAASTLAAWRRQLPPGPFWVADLLLHRIEACVSVEKPGRADPLSVRILTALARSPALDSLQRETGLPRQFLHQALTRLRTHGLIESRSLQLSPQGQHALQTGTYAHATMERRAFYFRTRIAGGAAFLPLSGMVGESCPPPEDWRFDIAVLDDCLQRPLSWKERHGFPADVNRAEMPADDWRRVAIDTPIRWTAVLVRADSNQLRAYAVSGKENALDLTPQFTLDTEIATELFPELAPPGTEALTAAWQAWCTAHGCSTAEAILAGFEGDRLPVRSKLPEPLCLATSDESWLLVGSGDIRRALQIQTEEIR